MKEKEDHLEVENLKESLIYHTLLLGGILGLVTFIVSLSGWDRPESKYGFFVDFSIILIFFTTLLFHKKINLRNKVIIIISGIIVLVINDLYQFGVYADSVILLIIIPIFVFFGFGKNKTIVVFVLFAVIYFLFAFLYLSGSLITQVDITIHSLSFDIWVVKFLFIAIAAIVSFIVIKRFVDIYLGLIEEQKQQNRILSEAKKRIEESEIQFRQLFQNAADAIFIADNETHVIMDVNHAGEELMKRTKDEIIGLHQSELHPPDKQKFTAKTFNESKNELNNGEITTLVENFIIRKDGKEVPVEILASKVIYKGKKCIAGTFRDISNRKKAEIELRKAKEVAELNSANVTAIIEGATESIWAFNRNYEILYLNQLFKDEFYQTFGVILEPGKSLIDSLPEILRPFWKPRYDRVLANEQFFVEDEVPLGDDTIYIQVTFNPIVSEGKVVGGSCFGSNITLRKKAEKELLKAKEKAEESDRLKSAFLANMSHEIRTPMNGILGFADLLSTPGLDEQKHGKYVDIIKRSGTRMLNIISDIIDISKIESGQMPIQTTDFNVNEIVEQIYKILKLDAEDKEIELNCKEGLSGSDAIILSDKDKIYSILSNLVKNAIKYTDKGSIDFGYELREEKDDQILEFYVKDTGIGIPDSRQEAIFDRFVQADIEDTQARQGAGLGLAISKSLVEILGGNMWLKSQEGKGSEFYFSVRYIKANGDERGIDAKIKEESQSVIFDSDPLGLKILVVEDDEPSEMLLTIELEKYTRELIISRSGDDAVEVCRNNSDIDIIFMDIQLPKMNGYQATNMIREFNKDVIIIAQTAYGLEGDRDKALAAGCNDYISKPINSQDLISLVMKYFGKTAHGK